MDWLAVPHRVRELYPLCCHSFQEAIRQDADEFEAPGLGLLYKEGAAFKPLYDAWAAPQKPFGGPNPLTAMLLTGAAGAGLGYVGSKAMNAFTPNKYIDDKKRARNWAMIGGMLGLGIPGYLYARPALQLDGWPGMLGEPPLGPEGVPERRGYPTPSRPSATPEPELAKLSQVDPILKKCAEDAGATFAPIVPVDAFNNVLINDQYLPPSLKAATMGLTTAAQLSRGGAAMISPADIGRVAISMGSGWLAGMLVGKTLGALAGVRPEVQQTLQRTGAMAGLIKSVVPLVFN
jgi:hypothetical protein